MTTTDEAAADPLVAPVAVTGHTTGDLSRPGDSYGDLLVTFVPRLAPELAVRAVPSYTSIDGSMLSADISGFTALSERLAGKGKAGAEEITVLVNRCFTALITAAHSYDGEVLKFGGDALLVLFRGDDHARRAVDGGLAMQTALHTSAAAKRAHLTMTVGVADGPFDVFLVGSSYRELLVTGPRATEVIRLEGEAEKGDTLVSTTIAAALPAEMRVREAAGGWVVAGSTGFAPPGPVGREPDVGDLAPYVPAAVREQLAAFAGMGGEHRLVTVGFLMVGGIGASLAERGTDGTAVALHDLVDDVGAACAAFGVTLLHTDIAPDGVKFVLCAGAPINPGDTGDAMLQAALRIAAIDTPFVLRQGVQTGRVFAGFLGSVNRRTYTLMGDPVNTAARMLGRAHDRDVVAVASVVRGTRTIFVSDELEPFHVKGKSELITAHKVLAVSDAVRRDTTTTPLIGRRRELEILTSAIGELGEVVELVGPAGVGKSRLLDAAWDSAEGLQIFQAACTPYGAGSPYSVFRPLLRGGSGIPIEASPELAGRRLTEIVDATAPDLVPLLPLLAVPFGARVAPTPQADAVDPEHRRARIHGVVAGFLDATLRGPTLLVVEDAHWIDDASGELINHLIEIAASRPWAAIITRRPEGGWAIVEGPHVVRLDLEPLDAGAVRSLAIETSSRALTDRDLDLVVERSAGNPMFAIELSRALVESGGEVPETIEQIISSRIDQLDPATRRLVRTAAVLGTQFDEEIVRSMYDADRLLADDAGGPSADEALMAAAAAGTLGRRSGSTWAFHHALYRDTAYEGLPFSNRRILHHRAAQIIEARATDRDAVAPLLSLHYAAARSHELAWRYSLRAAEVARSQQATAEAALAYERALASSRYCRSLEGADRAGAAELLGDQLYLLGRFDDADRAYRRARRLHHDPVANTELVRKLAAVHERRGQPERAIRWYRRAVANVPPTARRPGWLVARARAALGEAGIRSRMGDNETCLALARGALADAERAGDEPTVALALERIHLALVFLRASDTDGTGERALAAHRALADHAGTARVLTNLGIEAYFADRWTDAGTSYLESLDAAERAGTVVPAATAAINSAEILSDQGDWARAMELFDAAIRNYRAVGYPAGIAAATLFWAVAAMRAGDLVVADERLASAREQLEDLGMAEWVDDLDSRRLELDVLRGTAVPDDGVRLLERFGAGHPFRVRVLRAVALTCVGHGDHAGARAALDEALASAPRGFERALTLLAAARTVEGERAQELSDEADAILGELGVSRPPPLTAADLSVRT